MHDGIVIALAWPETTCKQAGAWYDGLAERLGISRDGYYKVGHSALVLIDKDTGTCLYADFGRYHAPHGKGRVRTQFTDHDLTISTKAQIDQENGEVINLNSILEELYWNPSCHGDGAIYGAPFNVDFKLVQGAILQSQNRGFIAYGPFLKNGTNCSRFVNSILLSGKPEFASRVKLMFPPMLTPTPLWNLEASRSAMSHFTESERIEVEDDHQPILIRS